MDFKHQEIWQGKGGFFSNNKKYNGAFLFSYITCIRICWAAEEVSDIGIQLVLQIIPLETFIPRSYIYAPRV